MNKKLRQQVFEKFDGRCAYCGVTLVKGWQVDHVVPRARILQKHHNLKTHDDIENLFPACHSCNNYKGGNDLEEFRGLIDNLFNKPEYLFKSKTKMNIAIKHGWLNLPSWDKKFYFEQIKNKSL